MTKERRLDLDILKGLSIIAVVLYHVGLLPYGYLGVDTFLVISGFLTVPAIVGSIEKNNFSYFGWLQKRIFRFLPLVMTASIFCLLAGYFTMIPDDYENLSESIVASSVFCENILSAVTTKNYWHTANEFKPLMHLWYLGIIVQFYVLIPLVLMVARKLFCRSDNQRRVMTTAVFLLGLISFVLFVLPQFSFNEKFYYLPFRLWEFCAGALIGLIFTPRNTTISKAVYVPALAVLIGCFCCYFKTLSQIDNITIVGFGSIDATAIHKDIILITTVMMSSLLLLNKFKIGGGYLCVMLGTVGKMSFSIFVWHQIFLAFLRYSLVDNITLPIFGAYIVVVLIISWLSFKYIEPIKIDKPYKKAVCLGFWILIMAVSLFIYRNAGVVRDIPELGITTQDPLANRNTEYIDRIYGYQNPFTTDRTKVLVVGNSFARDFACCLLEWDVDNTLELSYMFNFTQTDTRFEECDFLFCFCTREDIPQHVWQALKPECEVYGIGTKSYGKTFGRIYARRFSNDYYDSAIPVHPKLEQANDLYKKSWGEQHFIDFVKASMREDGLIRLFTPDNKIISFDCEHLTPYGCRYLATKFDFDKIFK